jgi:hypothetical protein
MADMKKEQLAQAVRNMLVNCAGYEGDVLSESRKQAYDYYFQRPRGDELPGRSTIVTGDLSSMVEGNLAQMIDPLTRKRIAEFCAYDEQDEEQAQLESDCISDLIFKKQNGFIEVTSSIKDAMLVRNGVLKVYIDERTHVSRIRRSNVKPEIITDVLFQIDPDAQIHKYDPETGDLSATITKTTRVFRVESIAPENFLLPKDWHRQDTEGLPFCAERHVETRAALIERGFDGDIVKNLPRYTPASVTTSARLPHAMGPAGSGFVMDTSQELVEWYECYAQMDDGTGAAELRRICVSGGANMKVLDDEDADIICYALGVLIINPHTWVGISLHDKLKSTQDSSTALTRGLMDNLNAVNKNRTAHFDELVEADDLTDGRVNGSIRVKTGVVADVRQAITAFTVSDATANILANLQHFEKKRSEMGGASLDMATGQMQLSDRVGSQGLDRAYSVMEALSEFMTRMIAHTMVRSAYLIAHETLRTQWQGPISFKRGKEWLVTEPAKWRVRDSVYINLGESLGERARISAVLREMIHIQADLAARGMEDVLVDMMAFRNAVIEWLRVNDVTNPERFILDPRSPQAQKALSDKAKQRQAAQMKQEALMKEAIGLERIRTALQKYTADQSTQLEYYKTVLNAQIEEAKLAVSGVLDYVKAKASAAAAFVTGKKGKNDEPGETPSGKGTPEQSDTGGDAGSSRE